MNKINEPLFRQQSTIIFDLSQKDVSSFDEPIYKIILCFVLYAIYTAILISW